MEAIGWQEIVIRLLFTLIVGSATAIEKKWYITQQFIKTNTLMALGTAIFAILLNLTNNTTNVTQLILGISIICLGIGWQEQANSKKARNSRQDLAKFWCAGAIGSLIGFGLFLPAYISLLVVILTNLIFLDSEQDGAETRINDNGNAQDISLIQDKSPATKTYRCLINCFAADEAEVLSTLVQLGKKYNLTLTAIYSKDLPQSEGFQQSSNSSSGDHKTSEVEMTVDFIAKASTSIIQLQPIIVQLKSQLIVNSASWRYLHPEVVNKNKQVDYGIKPKFSNNC